MPSQPWLAIRATQFLEQLVEGDAISQTVVSRWLKGTHVPDSPTRAWAFAKALMVDPGWLMFGTETEAPAPDLLVALPWAPMTPVPKPRGSKKR